jgi:hypothetical protein
MTPIQETTFNVIQEAAELIIKNLDSIDYLSLSHDDKTKLAQSLGQATFINDNLKHLK